MKSKLIALIMVAGFGVQAQQINGTIYDLDSGRTQVIDARVIDPDKTHNEIMEIYRRMNSELSESNARMREEYYSRQQVYELQRQTKLLEKISNK